MAISVGTIRALCAGIDEDLKASVVSAWLMRRPYEVSRLLRAGGLTVQDAERRVGLMSKMDLTS